MTRYLAIDSGGSKTAAILAERYLEGSTSRLRTLARVHAPGCNQGGQIDCDVLQQAVDLAFQQAGQEPATVSRALLALAGAGDPEQLARVTRWAARQPLAHDCCVVPDVVPLLARAPVDGHAVALVCGTGSMAWGRAANSTFAAATTWRLNSLPWNESGAARCGGLGPCAGDYGSGYWIGRKAVREVTRRLDLTGVGSDFQRDIWQALGAHELRHVPAAMADCDRGAVAELVRAVLHHERQGDPLAGRILDQAAAHLADLIESVIRRLDLPQLDLLVLAGGVIVNAESLRQRVLRRLTAAGLSPHEISCVTDPVQLVLAAINREAAG